MKYISTFCILVSLFSFKGIAQQYYPFPIKDAQWNVLYMGTCIENQPPDTSILRYVPNGDTTLNGITYTKLYLAHGDTLTPTQSLIGYLREDGQRIFYSGNTIMGTPTAKETLLYDFTVHVGDTIHHNSLGFYSEVLAIDSVQIGATFRKRYTVNNHTVYHNPDMIIEGIGSVLNGLLGHISPVPTCGTHYWEAICFKEQNQVLYLNPQFEDCYPYASSTLSVTASDLPVEFKIYPNPFTQTIQVVGLPDQKITATLLTVDGTQIFSKIPLQTNTIEMPQTLASGLYILQLADENGKVILRYKVTKDR